MRRLLSGLLLLALFAVACTGDDGPGEEASPSMTVIPNTTTSLAAIDSTTVPTPTSFPDPPIEEPELVDVNLMRCLDAECGRIQVVRLDEQQKLPPMTGRSGVREVIVRNTLERSDGRPLVVAEWFTPHLVGEGWDSQMVLYSCADVACSSVTSQVVVEGANSWSSALLPDGSLAISYQTGQEVLCGPAGCADPERNDLASLELLICPDPDDCSAVGGSGRIVVLDREGMTGLWGGNLLVGPAGAPTVVYERELGPEVTEVRLARCSDGRCSDVSVSTVLPAEAGSLVDVAVLADGSPVLTQWRVFSDRQETRVIACEDPACSSWVVAAGFESRLGEPSDGVGGVATGADGSLHIALVAPIVEDTNFDGYSVAMVSCADRFCDSPSRSPSLVEHRGSMGWGGGGPVGVTNDGRAYVIYEMGAPEAGPAFLAYTVCDDPTCATATTQTLDDQALHVDLWDPASPSGLVMFTLQTDTE